MKRSFYLILVGSLILLPLLVLTGPSFINPFRMDKIQWTILIRIRLPRTAVAVLMGGALGASGAVLQGFLRNPLADPYILGLSAGAAFVATIAILTGLLTFGVFTIPLLSFVGAVCSGVLVGLMAYRKGGILPERLLLAGVGLGFLFSSALMLLLTISSDEGLRRAIHWVFGDLSMADWSLLPYGLILIGTGFFIAMGRAKSLNALMLGDEVAHSLGFNPYRERLLLFLSVSLMTASSVSLGGIVGFVGLVVPHMVRFFVGADSRKVIPFSALMGGVLLCLSDTLGRTVFAPTEVPSGLITSILGAPYFLYLLRRRDILGG